MGVQSSIKFGRLFRREWRFRSVLRDAFPKSFYEFYSLRKRKLFCSVYKIRAHAASLDADDLEDKRICDGLTGSNGRFRVRLVASCLACYSQFSLGTNW